MAQRNGGDPVSIAAALARRLADLDWVAHARVTGGGYVAVTVTAAALGALAVRIVRAGPGCARSGALRGVTFAAPRSPGLGTAATWAQTQDRLTRHLTGRLAAAAGATVTWTDDGERLAPPAPVAPAGQGLVAEAVAFAGASAIIWTLGRLPAAGRTAVAGTVGTRTAAGKAAAGRTAVGRTAVGRTGVALDPREAAVHDLRNPAYAVRYAHAHAVSALRQAADLGLDRGVETEFEPRLLAHPSEQALLDALSWLPERVAGAARRGRPDAFARYLEGLAGVYLGCQESCPAVWPGMPHGVSLAGCGPGGDGPPGGGVLVSDVTRGIPWPSPGRTASGIPGEPVTAARLWLVDAARTALATGLALFGVDAPDRL